MTSLDESARASVVSINVGYLGDFDAGFKPTPPPTDTEVLAISVATPVGFRFWGATLKGELNPGVPMPAGARAIDWSYNGTYFMQKGTSGNNDLLIPYDASNIQGTWPALPTLSGATQCQTAYTHKDENYLYMGVDGRVWIYDMSTSPWSQIVDANTQSGNVASNGGIVATDLPAPNYHLFAVVNLGDRKNTFKIDPPNTIVRGNSPTGTFGPVARTGHKIKFLGDIVVFIYGGDGPTINACQYTGDPTINTWPDITVTYSGAGHPTLTQVFDLRTSKSQEFIAACTPQGVVIYTFEFTGTELRLFHDRTIAFVANACSFSVDGLLCVAGSNGVRIYDSTDNFNDVTGTFAGVGDITDAWDCSFSLEHQEFNMPFPMPV